MSRNAVALKPSDSKRSVGRLRSVTSAIEPGKDELPSANDRVRQLKDLVSALLNEVQELEQDGLLLELSNAQNMRRLDIENGIKLDDVVSQFEKNIIQQALIITNGNQAQAARLLGVRPNTLNYKVKVYDLS